MNDFIREKIIEPTPPSFFISKRDSMHTIICNKKSIEIPIDMNVHEFQMFTGLYGNVYNITNNSECTYYQDDTFTSNGTYYTTEYS
jgi:hypothetical protein